jgi:hypothetical protein
VGSIPITRFSPRSARIVSYENSRLKMHRLYARPRGFVARRGAASVRKWVEISRIKAAVAQLVERVLGKDEVLGSNPSGSSGV